MVYWKRARRGVVGGLDLVVEDGKQMRPCVLRGFVQTRCGLARQLMMVVTVEVRIKSEREMERQALLRLASLPRVTAIVSQSSRN